MLTSPPYALGKEYEKGTSLESMLVTQERVIEECFRVLKPEGSICWQVGNYVKNGEIVPLDILLYKRFRKLGMQLRNRIIWHFEHGMHATYRFSGRYESIMWFTRSDEYFFDLDRVRVPQKQPTKKFYRGPRKGQLSCNPLGKNPGDVWKITNVKNGHPEKIADGHPCQFPLALVERFVLSMTKPGDWVLDPFGGVASTLVSAVAAGRVGLGAELQKKYHASGLKRLRALAAAVSKKPSHLTNRELLAR